MSNILKAIVLSSFITLFLSCSDDRLDIDPTEQVALSEANKSVEGLMAVKNSVYRYLGRYQAFGRDIIVIGDLLSDDSFVIPGNSRFLALNNITYSQVSNDTYPIDPLYDVIVHANSVINTTLPETNEVKNIKAEAMVARALALFYAVNLYSSSILSNTYQDYGVPTFTGNYDVNAVYPRSSISGVYQQIESDLLISLTLFQRESGKEYFGPTAAKQLLSKVYLYQQKWQQAYNYAVEVENTSGNFQFVDKANYKSYFTTKNAPETVFEIGYSSINGNSIQNEHVAAVYAKNGAYAQNVFKKNLVDLYDPSDVRGELFTFDSKSGGYYTTKYIPDNNYSQNIKVLRMSEAKLNKIESLYHLGNEAQALTELNAFVATRGSYSYSGLSGQSLLDAILKERRLEFAAEGYSFFDLKRNGLAINKTSDCTSQCLIIPSSMYFILPMPQREMDTNFKMEQHPLYNK